MFQFVTDLNSLNYFEFEITGKFVNTFTYPVFCVALNVAAIVSGLPLSIFSWTSAINFGIDVWTAELALNCEGNAAISISMPVTIAIRTKRT